MTIFEFLKEDVTKVVAWVKEQEPKVVSDIQAAANFTTKAIAWAKSPQGIAVESFIAAAFPQAAAWEEPAMQLMSELLTDMLAVKSVAALESIAERLGAEIWNILDGGKKPTGISGYISEFQSIFVP